MTISCFTKPRKRNNNIMPPNADHASIIGSSECVFESKPTTIMRDFAKIPAQPPLTRRTRKSVSWAPTALAYNITHVNDMSEEDIKTVWYEPKEYKASKKDCKKTATLAAMEGLLLDSNSPMTTSFCARGLEQIVDKSVGRLRHLRRKNMRYIVLDEQRDQFTTGTYDPESYEELCYEISATAHRQAHMQAMQDYEEVLEQNVKDDRKQAALSKHTPLTTAGASASLKVSLRRH
jgi:hypothetical protein